MFWYNTLFIKVKFRGEFSIHWSEKKNFPFQTTDKYAIFPNSFWLCFFLFVSTVKLGSSKLLGSKQTVNSKLFYDNHFTYLLNKATVGW